VTAPQYTVRYPVSGQVLRVRGLLLVGDLGGIFAVGIVPVDPAAPIVIVDPRCTIEADGQVAYRP
jgi:hypothetical protein